jgi:hypothetical protein
MVGRSIHIEQFMKWKVVVETEALRENPLQCNVIHLKSHVNRYQTPDSRWVAGD